MINTEILYKFTRAGNTYTQVGVRHLPRHGGRATGAKLSVILRAFQELFVYAIKWHREEKQLKKIARRKKPGLQQTKQSEEQVVAYMMPEKTPKV
ncbi:MAG TPA: hypothetical protein VEL49_02105, partial [Ktedonobacteraceae bacterium]|nr:hypothetical protein [Ktedonobacteraceae bacterium]